MKRIGVPNKRYTVGVGYIIIPSGVNRDKYIINALRKEEVDILTQDGSYINKVLIDKDCLQRIDFPIDEENPGSCVVYINEFVHNQPIIVAVLSKGNENQLLKDSEFKLYKKTKNGIVCISGRGDTSQLFIQIISDNDNGGDFYVDLSNKTKTSKLNLSVKGNINIHSTSNFHIDSDENILLGKNNLNSAVLGEKLKDFLDDFITEVSNITVDGSPIANKAQILLLKNDTDEFLSNLNKLE